MGLHPVVAFNEGFNSKRFFEILGLPYLRAEIQGFKAKFGGGDSGLTVCMGYSKPKITIGIMGLRENLDQDERIGEPYWELSSILGTDSLKFGSALTMCIHNFI